MHDPRINPLFRLSRKLPEICYGELTLRQQALESGTVWHGIVFRDNLR